ncbi:MAG: hypothetical protein QM786_15245 [Breznakibacter sp.]
MTIKSRHILFFLLTVLLTASCEREYLFRGDNRGLKFSADTVMFDTVFTSFGSATAVLKIYNPYQEDMSIDAVELVGGENSNFRVNINGTAASFLQDVKIRERDSLFIFVEVTIDPAGVDVPFVVTDSILFHTRERIQSVKLIAYGQDVIVLRKEKLQTQTFTKGKPYLIYDYAVVDSFQQLTIEPGAKLHFHKDASLLVLGSLVANGKYDDPIVIEGDRLEDFYSDIPGQWGFLQFLPGSKNNQLHHTIIRNGTMGIRADSIGNGNEPPLILGNCRFEHISSIGLLAETSNILAYNCLFADCGLHSVALTVGGNYEFYHCTIANFFNRFKSRTTEALLLNNHYTDDNNNKVVVPLKKALFANCIIYGYNYSEIDFDLQSTSNETTDMEINYCFDHSLIKVNASSVDLSNSKKFINVINGKTPSFIDSSKYDYRLDTLSAAQNAGKKEYGLLYPKDILNADRLTDGVPDLGIYERIEKQ